MENLRKPPGDRRHVDVRGHAVKPELTSDSMAFLSVCSGLCEQGRVATGALRLWKEVRQMTQILSDPAKHILPTHQSPSPESLSLSFMTLGFSFGQIPKTLLSSYRTVHGVQLLLSTDLIQLSLI